MPITLGSLRGLLLECEPEARVLINGKPPVSIQSYRGFYEQAAITITEEAQYPDKPELDEKSPPFASKYFSGGVYSPGHSEMKFPQNPTVAQVIEGIELCYGEEFEGYKGGQYVFHANTDVWQSEYGSCSQLAVVGVSDEVSVVRIEVKGEGW